MTRQTLDDLQPFEGRLAMTWRIALLCALVAGAAMLLKIPESAISCYLIIFLMRPDSASVNVQAIGLIILASVVVLLMAPLIQATADNPFMRIVVIAATSFVFLWLASASQLGETASIIALVVAFILTLVDHVPAGLVVTKGLFFAWKMAVLPMALMIVFNLLLGTAPHRLARKTIAERLEATAGLIESESHVTRRNANDLLAAGNVEPGQQAMLTKVIHSAPRATSRWLSGAVTTSYEMLLAASALPASIGAETRERLARQCRAAAVAVQSGLRPAPTTQDCDAVLRPASTMDRDLVLRPASTMDRDLVLRPASTMDRDAGPGVPALAGIERGLEGLSASNGGTDARPSKPPFLAADAFTNPDHQRYALKTTAAAIISYLIYSLSDWEGIATAMVTCYVAALGTTGETVHKLALRICGCLIGAALGLGSILFVIPHLTSVGGLMALVFCGVMVAAWVSTGPERISYGGVQIGLAFLLTILNGFAPSLDMDAARDRVVGILLGNLVVYLIFTGIWSKTTTTDVAARLTTSLRHLALLAALPATARESALPKVQAIEADMGKAEDELAMSLFETRHQRPKEVVLARLRALVAEVRLMTPALMYAPSVEASVPGRLAAAAAAVSGGDVVRDRADGTGEDEVIGPPAGPGTDRIEFHTRRIEQLA